MLNEKGYRCVVEQEKLLEHAGLFNLYATRDEAADEIGSDSGAVESVPTGMRQACQTDRQLEAKYSGILRRAAIVHESVYGSFGPVFLSEDPGCRNRRGTEGGAERCRGGACHQKPAQ